mmetsp:Transcript_56071/g.163827  ORF Transcript_56071/g.163827 Transcript_56071/m.163827 type:complete len:263 (+) Transcript_56071:304-1092(+)
MLVGKCSEALAARQMSARDLQCSEAVFRKTVPNCRTSRSSPAVLMGGSPTGQRNWAPSVSVSAVSQGFLRPSLAAAARPRTTSLSESAFRTKGSEGSTKGPRSGPTQKRWKDSLPTMAWKRAWKSWLPSAGHRARGSTSAHSPSIRCLRLPAKALMCMLSNRPDIPTLGSARELLLLPLPLLPPLALPTSSSSDCTSPSSRGHCGGRLGKPSTDTAPSAACRSACARVARCPRRRRFRASAAALAASISQEDQHCSQYQCLA